MSYKFQKMDTPRDKEKIFAIETDEGYTVCIVDAVTWDLDVTAREAAELITDALNRISREAGLERVLRECARFIDSGGDPTALSRDVLVKQIHAVLESSQ